MSLPAKSKLRVHRRELTLAALVSAALSVPVILSLTNSGEMSESLLQWGGRIIIGTTERPEAIIAASVASLGFVWIGIAVCCWWEGKSASAPQDASPDSSLS